MTDEQNEALQRVLNALCFYANSNIYWGTPLSLEENYDRRTLKACHESREASEIMKDRGATARDALYEFEGVFECHYDVRTEP